MLWGGVDALDSIYSGVKPLYPPFLNAFQHHSSKANWCLTERSHAADPEKQTRFGISGAFTQTSECTLPPVMHASAAISGKEAVSVQLLSTAGKEGTRVIREQVTAALITPPHVSQVTPPRSKNANSFPIVFTTPVFG